MCLGIILFRISSMYGHNRSVFILLSVVMTTEFFYVLILNIVAELYSFRTCDSTCCTFFGFGPQYLTVFIAVPQLPGLVPCGTRAPASWIWVMWFLPCIYEIVVLVLAVRIALQHRRSLRLLGKMSLPSSRRGSLLLYVLLRDSIIFPTMYVNRRY